MPQLKPLHYWHLYLFTEQGKWKYTGHLSHSDIVSGMAKDCAAQFEKFLLDPNVANERNISFNYNFTYDEAIYQALIKRSSHEFEDTDSGDLMWERAKPLVRAESDSRVHLERIDETVPAT